METALFSPASLFGNTDIDEDTDCCSLSGSEQQKEEQPFVERTHAFPNLQLKIGEFSFHELNANLLWPGTFAFAEWLVHHQSFLHDQRILELGSDILLYVKQYPNLIKTLCFLLKTYQPQNRKTSITISGEEIELGLPIFMMSWQRRIRKKDEQLFFGGCEQAGLTVRHVGSRVYCITVSHQSSD